VQILMNSSTTCGQASVKSWMISLPWMRASRTSMSR